VTVTMANETMVNLAPTEARMILRDAAAAAEEAAARARSLSALLDESLAALGATAPAPPREAMIAAHALLPGASTLSPREREVLALVAEGRTNKAIGEALFVSPNTVKTHVTSLLHKLQADSRVQLAAIATRQGLRRGAIDAR
jgi:DNA-binding NarL/FixJ family response regulator